MSSKPSTGIPVVLSGPSGAGKTTIQKQLLSRYQDLVPSISATTRPPRPGEVHGKDYLFLSEPEFQSGTEQNLFLEHAQVHGHFYGTPKGPLEEHLHLGVDVLLVIDVQGGLQIRSACTEAVLIFLLPPSMADLAKRIDSRGDVPPGEMQVRLRNAEWEMSFATQYDYLVINRNLDEAVSQVRSILVADRCRTQRAVRRIHHLGIDLPGLEGRG